MTDGKVTISAKHFNITTEVKDRGIRYVLKPKFDIETWISLELIQDAFDNDELNELRETFAKQVEEEMTSIMWEIRQHIENRVLIPAIDEKDVLAYIGNT